MRNSCTRSLMRQVLLEVKEVEVRSFFLHPGAGVCGFQLLGVLTIPSPLPIARESPCTGLGVSSPCSHSSAGTGGRLSGVPRIGGSGWSQPIHPRCILYSLRPKRVHLLILIHVKMPFSVAWNTSSPSTRHVSATRGTVWAHNLLTEQREPRLFLGKKKPAVGGSCYLPQSCLFIL